MRPWFQSVPDLYGRPDPEEGDPEPILKDLTGTGDKLDLSRSDAIELVWVQGRGGLQPLVWPMMMHVHGQECGRA